ncbi:unnamed protein product [Blepharisma stoltei]|uniref:Cysteine protease n=1 Tax=Blepharisma stoltei TaxID=1481888 RepID=A0AAU9IW17_9CILI|nr:unnamed protein product [Blepharisma stoltei]
MENDETTNFEILSANDKSFEVLSGEICQENQNEKEVEIIYANQIFDVLENVMATLNLEERRLRMSSDEFYIATEGNEEIEKDKEAAKQEEVNYYPACNDETNWFSKFGTNIRYKLEDIENMPIFGYDKADFDENCSDIVLLARIYRISAGKLYKRNSFVIGNPRCLKKKFFDDFKKLIWVTYRSGFRPLQSREGGSVKSFTSDVGWGCTIRVGQMMLLNTLKRHLKGSTTEIDLLKLIQENSFSAGFSLHKFMEISHEFLKKPGDWHSPSMVSHFIEKLSEINQIPNFKVKVFMDSMLYRDQVYAIATEKPIEEIRKICICPDDKDEVIKFEKVGDIICSMCNKKTSDYTWKNSVLLIFPLMLGFKKIQPEYSETIKFFLSLPQTAGAIGGKPRSALYLVGYQGNSLLFLDPHFVQPSLTGIEELSSSIDSYHCDSPKLIPINSAESSISLCFYIKDELEFNKFLDKIEENRRLIHGVILVKNQELKQSNEEMLFFQN